jgi:hypothetical protein
MASPEPIPTMLITTGKRVKVAVDMPRIILLVLSKPDVRFVQFDTFIPTSTRRRAKRWERSASVSSAASDHTERTTRISYDLHGDSQRGKRFNIPEVPHARNREDRVNESVLICTWARVVVSEWVANFQSNTKRRGAQRMKAVLQDVRANY